MPIKKVFFSAFIFLIPLFVLAADVYRQGDTVVISLSGKNLEAQTALFDGQPVSFFSYKDSYRIVFGVPATKKAGTYKLKIVFKNNEIFEKTISVRAGKVSKIVLGVPEKLGLTPTALTQELGTKNQAIRETVATSSPMIYFTGFFGLPLADNRKISSPFGEIRQTGGQEIRHLGTDFEAAKGASVYAINNGKVAAAYNDSIYGNTVIIDHGVGIFSLYMHLDKILIKEGDLVKKGKTIGKAGDTGYAEKPHLHLSLKINGVSVDPVRFVYSLK